MKTHTTLFIFFVLLLGASSCQDRTEDACEATKWPASEDRTVAVKVKLPPLVIAGTDTVPIENFYQINITGTMNKKYCSGETKGERALALSIYNDINNFTYYTLPDKMIYTFANDMDAVEVSLQLEAILVNGTRYKSGTDYQIYRPESIRLDIYNFYHYVEFVVTNQSTGWSKVL